MAAVKPAPILFVVNSNINAFIQARPAMLKCQVVLRQTVYGFLDYDSYLNCDRAIASFKPSTIEDQILSNPRRLKAALTSASRSLVIKAVEDSENISPQRKNWVFEELKPTD